MELNIILLFIIIVLLIINLFSKSLSKFFLLKKNKSTAKWSVIELKKAIVKLSKKKTGAIIAFEKANSLKEYINKAEELNANVSEELIISIFQKKSPLHDGAIIISDGKIKVACAYFPTSNKNIEAKYGARHRAAIGLSASTDAFVIVVSETTGKITFANKGKLNPLDVIDLEHKIKELI